MRSRNEGIEVRAAGPVPAATPVTEAETRSDTRVDRPWNVIVWDDPINLMVYVVYVFQTLFGMPREKATRHMLEVHQQGRSVVATTDREQAEFYVTRLHRAGLQATMEQVEA